MLRNLFCISISGATAPGRAGQLIAAATLAAAALTATLAFVLALALGKPLAPAFPRLLEASVGAFLNTARI